MFNNIIIVIIKIFKIKIPKYHHMEIIKINYMPKLQYM